MANFITKLWKNEPSVDTPLNDDGLNDLESRVAVMSESKADMIHAARHAAGGADPITPASIGAAPVVAGKIPASYFPPLVIGDTFMAASQAAMLALSDAERGDVAVRTDLSKTFILKAEPYSTLANWQELLTPTSSVSSVAGKQGAVTLVAADITDLASILAGKASATDVRFTTLPARSVSASTTLTGTDAGGMVQSTAAGAFVLTLPTNAAEAIPVNSVFTLLNFGASTFTVTGTGLTSKGSKFKVTSAATLIKTAADAWYLSGDTAA